MTTKELAISNVARSLRRIFRLVLVFCVAKSPNAFITFGDEKLDLGRSDAD